MTPDDRGSRPIAQELIIPGLALGFCAYFFWTVQELSWEAKANGLVIGSVLVVLVGAFLLRILLRLRSGRADLRFRLPGSENNNHRTRLALVGFSATFLLLLPWLGTTLSLALLLLACMWLLGAPSWKAMIGVAVGAPLVVYALMIVALGTRFPLGPFEQLMAWLFGIGGEG
ncbi:tripartite tricarboxylate transporter TctB family protein [Roseomonas sp. BN140053]|uniref:tripartite tricarboxylate transporter TctB family protein n=1 Tax=Roseomonas sp. BN140053 TaxID=3391898 RepID=UPI0039EB7C61